MSVLITDLMHYSLLTYRFHLIKLIYLFVVVFCCMDLFFVML